MEHDKLLDSGAEIMCSNMPPNVQIEGKINAHDSTPTNASSMSFEEVKDDCLAATIVVPMPLKKIMNDGTYSYVAPEDVEVIMHQNPSENESHIAKLSVNENKIEMCHSTKSEVESINKRSVRDTPHKRERELHCKTCEDDLNTNPLMSTPSVVSQNMQVCKGNKEEIVDHNTTILDDISEKVVTVDNQFFATPNLNHDNDGGKNSEIQSTVHAPSSNLKGDENNLNMNL